MSTLWVKCGMSPRLVYGHLVSTQCVLERGGITRWGLAGEMGWVTAVWALSVIARPHFWPKCLLSCVPRCNTHVASSQPPQFPTIGLCPPQTVSRPFLSYVASVEYAAIATREDANRECTMLSLSTNAQQLVKSPGSVFSANHTPTCCSPHTDTLAEQRLHAEVYSWQKWVPLVAQKHAQERLSGAVCEG